MYLGVCCAECGKQLEIPVTLEEYSTFEKNKPPVLCKECDRKELETVPEIPIEIRLDEVNLTNKII